MQTHLEESLQRDTDRIRDNVIEMARRAEKALQDCVAALVNSDRKLAYAVILRDLFIDKQEEEIDRLCLEFILRQQPVAGNLRFAYSTFKINLEIERVGDYAESIARHVLKLSAPPAREIGEAIVEMANLSTSMFRSSVRAFVDRDVDLARRSIEVEETVDRLRTQVNRALVAQLKEQTMAFEDFDPLMTIAKRFERVSDQARNICMEVQYMCTGQYVKHPGADQFRVLFVDDTGSCLGQMAEAIGRSLNQPKFAFNSAGLSLRAIDPGTVAFMREKGIDLSAAAPRAVEQIKNIDHYHVVVALSRGVQRSVPYVPRKAVFLDWHRDDPSSLEGAEQEKREAYERTYQFLKDHISDLMHAVLGAEPRKEGA
jgi:phosphate transport system protein